MRGKWCPSDLLLAAQGKLHFTSQQTDIIRAEVAARPASRAKAAGKRQSRRKREVDGRLIAWRRPVREVSCFP
jgi:hypothetical protein